MNTLDDYLNAPPEKRPAMVAANRPPAVQTHRGKPLPWALRGYVDATREKRTPTHRKAPTND